MQGAIFDCDGTLLDSLGAWRSLEGYLFDLAGIQVTLEERAQFATFTIPEVAAHMHTQHGLGSSKTDVERMMDNYMLDYYHNRASLLPGVGRFLEECAHAGIAMSVASSSRPSYLEAGLAGAGIRDYFCAVVSVDQVGASKREPQVFNEACRLMGTPKEATWGFEDSTYALRTLSAAGYSTVGIFTPDEGLSFEQWQELSTITITSFEELSLQRFAQ